MNRPGTGPTHKPAKCDRPVPNCPGATQLTALVQIKLVRQTCKNVFRVDIVLSFSFLKHN